MRKPPRTSKSALRSSVQQTSVKPGQAGEREVKEDGQEHKVKEKDVCQGRGTKILAVGGNSGASEVGIHMQ